MTTEKIIDRIQQAKLKPVYGKIKFSDLIEPDDIETKIKIEAEKLANEKLKKFFADNETIIEDFLNFKNEMKNKKNDDEKIFETEKLICEIETMKNLEINSIIEKILEYLEKRKIDEPNLKRFLENSKHKVNEK